MLDVVDIGKRSLATYRGVAPDEQLDALFRSAERLRGARCLHLSATPYGGGVSEILRSLVPLYNDLGIVADWKLIHGDDTFFQVTKRIHNGLQGAPGALTESEKAIYLANSQLNARRLIADSEDYDFIFVHDPQPLVLASLSGNRDARWIWRCHIDTSRPNPSFWELLAPYLLDYDAAIFTLQEFIPPALPIEHVRVYAPAIDPLSPKNHPLPQPLARDVLEWIGIRTHRPLVTQVSRFDRWKDPMGVVRAYQRVRPHVPDLQLALVGSLAMDDPEGWDCYEEVRAATAHDSLIHVLTNLVGVGNIEVNALQTYSDVVVQKSLREGFGLVVSEALWKGTPVVGGRVGGIPLQLREDSGGILVDSVEECAEAMLHLLRQPEEARLLGERGREHVRQHFLMPRLLLDHLHLMDTLSSARPLPSRDIVPSPLTAIQGV
ncbi:group 1 glycosyl transferase [Myxococcus stipitatus DSM 14675]|uniref:Group 1 glycosyl transferase n=1 Tax=Myxococcus stipitatus (strain DSM 14675 / JCM 12634 / Mx s8) TaxID=1278073 RepID=L7U3E8_MYXSD|nr:glycosyltransferase [Myxococcus stipitatus]AGC42107.1 group 1 glycosyl transferase [Myxococcus stipitatus DSM 14675]